MHMPNINQRCAVSSLPTYPACFRTGKAKRPVLSTACELVRPLWIKLGGDHGGGSFKFVLQIVNVQRPNSLLNTIPICIFEAQDTPSNLETALGVYRDEVRDLQTTATWKNKSFKLFFFGDYEYQTKAYGLSGSSGTDHAYTVYVRRRIWTFHQP